MVTTNPGARADTLVLLDERVDSLHLIDEHGALQLLERLRWAIADAEDAARIALERRALAPATPNRAATRTAPATAQTSPATARPA